MVISLCRNSGKDTCWDSTESSTAIIATTTPSKLVQYIFLQLWMSKLPGKKILLEKPTYKIWQKEKLHTLPELMPKAITQYKYSKPKSLNLIQNIMCWDTLRRILFKTYKECWYSKTSFTFQHLWKLEKSISDCNLYEIIYALLWLAI